ncbi:conserved protein of unknown function [Tenacibaculum sp. 190524A02b]|uniref:hypothetical protein n=1 Tax=Tenacibaculum vairaonense TaxID=3137860 RepID=UPI0032B2D0B1
MKKALLFIVLSSVVLISCTDNTLEELETKKNEIKFTEPGDDGDIRETDPDDDGEG